MRIYILKSYTFLIIIIIALFSGHINGQSIASYVSARNTAITYTTIAGTGTSAFIWRNTTSNLNDDNRSYSVPIGFDFWYIGVRYTTISAQLNGAVDFSSSTVDGNSGTGGEGDANYFTSFSGGNGAVGNWLALAPLFQDLWTANGGTNPIATSLVYKLSGVVPNRVLTVEWINFDQWNSPVNTPAYSVNMQVKIYETTGVIEFVYGTMTDPGTPNTAGNTCGINNVAVSARPLATQLLTQQTINTTTFNNTPSDALPALPASNSQLTFTPPTPTAAPTGLSFTAVTKTGMTLNWTDNATNEVGYVIYNSTDGVNYNFATQVAANSVSAIIIGLLPSTTYYWKVYAVTEGKLSTGLTGTQATLPALRIISIITGNWNTTTTWDCNCIPTAGDSVIIDNGHNVTLDANGTCYALNVGQGITGQLTIGNNATARTLTVSKDIRVMVGATMVTGITAATHLMTMGGNFTNNGTVNFAPTATRVCNITFNKNGNQTISGTGATTNFNRITLNMGISSANVLDIISSNFSVLPTNFLTLTNGTFKTSTATTVLTPFTGAVTIPLSAGIWINNAGATMSTGATVTLFGSIRVTVGILNIGNAANENLTSYGGTIIIDGGTVNIAGCLDRAGPTVLTNFTMSSGMLTVATVGSTTAGAAPFRMDEIGSTFNMSGGTLIIRRPGAGNLGYVNTGGTVGAVTGGTLQIGDASTPATQTMQINASIPIYNLVVSNGMAVTAQLVTNSLTVKNNLTINAGTLNANALNITLGGNWTNNGGSFVPGTNTVSFTGTTAQTIFKSGGETFNNITFSNAGAKTLLSAVTASNVLINSGSNLDVNTANNQISVKGNFSNNGTFNAQNGLVLLNGAVVQSIGGSTITGFYDLSLNNAAGANLTNAENLINTLTLSNGTFSTNAQVFTMVSTATNTARIAQITGGDIIGNVTVQRFAPGGSTGWALLGTPISSALTFQDWNDNFAISCPTCPNGSAGGFLSIYWYDETAIGSYSAAASYVPLTGITDPITPNKGYWVYLGTGATTTTPITIDVTGTVRKFNNVIPLTRTSTGSAIDDGWNLIHNPYPSPISWSALRSGNASVDNAIYTYNADLNAGTGGTASYVNGVSSPAVGSGGIGDVIPMCQGFQVHCTVATSFTAQESNKVAGNPTFLKMNQSAQVASTVPLLRLYLDGPTSFHDETVLYMQPGATNNFDSEYDAIKMAGQDPFSPLILLTNGAEEFQINGVNTITSSFSMPLKTITGYTGTYTISLSNFNSFPTGACMSLYDKFNGITTDLKTNDYIFNLIDTTTVARFILNITINPLNITTAISQPICSNPNAGKVSAFGNNAGPWNYFWKDANGAIVKTSLNKTTADTLSNLTGGNYTLDINTIGQCDNNNSTFTISTIKIANAQFTSVDTVVNGVTINFNNTSLNAVNNSWSFGDGFGFSSNVNPIYNYSSAGIYTVSLIATSSSGCMDTALKSIVVVSGITTGLSSQNNTSSLLLKTIYENEFLLQGSIDGSSLLNIKLMDALGKLISDYGNFNSDNIILSMNLKNLKAGIYYLNITGAKTSKTIKLPVK